MTAKTVAAAKRAAAAAKRAKTKAEQIAALHKEEEAGKLAAEISAHAKEAEDAAAEIEEEAQRQADIQAKIKAEDPPLWERFKKWFE